MVKFRLPIQKILGSSYYDYNIYTSSYNPLINSDITVTCQLRNVFGSPVKDKELTLQYKGISQGVQTTNANGIAEWNINTGANGGTFKLTINNHYLFVTVGGYNVVKTHTNNHYQLSINEQTRMARLRVYFGGDANIGTGNQYIASNFIDAEYRPKQNVIGTMTRSGTLLGYVLTSGEVGVTNNGTSTITPTFASEIIWSYD